MSDDLKDFTMPTCTEDEVATGLRTITRFLREVTGEGPRGFLGGDNGYGVEYENDVFMMHPFCWCERPDCPWCLGCECEVEERGGDYVVVDECVNCKNDNTETAPNFLYKPTGAEVSWYKYIGRSMDIQGELPLDFHIQCIKSIHVSESCALDGGEQ